MTNHPDESRSSKNLVGQQGLVPVAIFVVCLVVLTTAVAMYQLRQGVIDRISSSTQNLAISVNQTFDSLIDAVDLALLASGDEISRQNATGKPDTQAISRYLATQAKRIPHVAYIRSTDARGDVVYGPGIPMPYVNLADREFFNVLRSEPQTGLFIAKPVVGKIAKKPVVTFARGVRLADGSFAGTVYASMFVDEFEGLLQQINLEKGSSLALRDRNLGLIARHTFGFDNPIGMGTTRISIPFQDALKSNVDVGTYWSDATSIDPVRRIYSYHRSLKYGYYVNVGLLIDPAMQLWQIQAVIAALLVLVLGSATIGYAHQKDRARARLRDHLAALESSRLALQTKHQQLLDVEKQHRELLANLHTAVIVHGPDSSILFSNARAAELLGLTDAQLSGKTAMDPAWCFVDEAGSVIAPQDYPVSAVIATHQPIDEMVLGVRVPYRNWLVWLLVSAFPEFDDAGALKQVVVNFYDVTKRREADERWQFALKGAGDGVWDVNLETMQAVYSKRYQEMLGYAEGEFSGEQDTWQSHVHPDDAMRVTSHMIDFLKSPSGAYVSEYRMRCKDGCYKWILSRGMVVSLGANGKPMRIVGTHTDTSDLKAAESRIWHEANFDPLTRLPNRRLFYDRLEMKIKKAQRDQELIALLFIDLDRFKEVNDTLGHQIGEQLWIEAAQRIKETVRDYDTVARLGGDEFTVVIAEQHLSFDIGSVAQKVIDRLSEPFILGDSECFVSASIGIAIYPQDALSVNDMVKNADQAMYAAKAGGRRAFRFFTKGMQETAIARMDTVRDLRQALAASQFEVHYQPIVELASGKVTKAEALVRWRHPVRGLVPPAMFIPIAEEIGVIHEIGDWVFLQAVNQLLQWQRQHAADFQVSVNKSPVQFVGDRTGHEHWIERLQALGISGSSLVIEITEGVLMDDNAKIVSSLLQFRDAGIQVAIDDFGTGYSSLAYLKKFDIDYLKIDRSFVNNLCADSPDYALCEAIVVMAHKLGLRVVAEGVESLVQHDALLQMGCDFGQGYLYSKALPASDFDLYMKDSESNWPPGQ